MTYKDEPIPPMVEATVDMVEEPGADPIEATAIDPDLRAELDQLWAENDLLRTRVRELELERDYPDAESVQTRVGELNHLLAEHLEPKDAGGNVRIFMADGMPRPMEQLTELLAYARRKGWL